MSDDTRNDDDKVSLEVSIADTAKRTVATTNAFFSKVVNKLFPAEADPDNFADIAISDEDRKLHQHFLREKGLMGPEEHVIAFYNNALISPLTADKTNTCIFVTEDRISQIKDSALDCEVWLDNLVEVEVEHNSIFSNDYLVLYKRDETFAVKMEVIRESVGNSFKRLLDGMIGDQGRVLLLEFKEWKDEE